MKKQQQNLRSLLLKYLRKILTIVLGILTKFVGGRLGLWLKGLYYGLLLTTVIFSAVPLDLIQHYVHLEPVLYPIQLLAAGVKNIMQFIGITILTYFTDLPESASKLLRNLPKGTLLPEIDCISTNNMLNIKNVKAAVVGHGDSEAYADGKGIISWFSTAKEKVNNLLYSPEEPRTYKDYLRYTAYALFAFFFAFMLLACYNTYYGDGGGSSGGANNGGSNANGTGRFVVHPGSTNLGEGGSGEGSSSKSGILAGLGMGARIWKIKNYLLGLLGLSKASEVRPPRPSDDSLDITQSDFSHFFRRIGTLYSETLQKGDHTKRFEEIEELERRGINLYGCQYRVDQYNNCGQYWIPIDGELKLLWELTDDGYAKFFVDNHPLADFGLPDNSLVDTTPEYASLLSKTFGPADIIRGDHINSPPSTHIELGGMKTPNRSFLNEDGKSLEGINPDWNMSTPRQEGLHLPDLPKPGEMYSATLAGNMRAYAEEHDNSSSSEEAFNNSADTISNIFNS